MQDYSIECALSDELYMYGHFVEHFVCYKPMYCSSNTT